MKAITYLDVQTIACRTDLEIPKVREGWALIRGAYAGICGSDLIIYSGTHPRAKAPLIMGHEMSGTIVEGHPTLPPGTPVAVNPLLSCGKCEACAGGDSHVCETLGLLGIDADGGMAEYILAPIHKIVPLPENVSLKMGAFIEPVAVAVHAIRKGAYQPGDTAVVYGAGAIGLCTALTLRKFGALNMVVLEPNALRAQVAKDLGFTVMDPLQGDLQGDLQAEIKNLWNGKGIDTIFDCAGHPAVMSQIPQIIKPVGKIVVVGTYKKPPEVNLQIGMFKELSFQCVRVYTDMDFKIAAKLVAQEKDYEKVVTHVLKPEQAQEGFDYMLHPSGALKVMFCFE
ncbi:alcohol dehydrogenase catalytic domain-containing protein [Oscillospiraceae bacterium MB08-C2-2]|nr:alcohol dehydrogenase catalytic domain-containing protein [Oscillospiraceae bacterium MB08-C2-2]